MIDQRMNILYSRPLTSVTDDPNDYTLYWEDNHYHLHEMMIKQLVKHVGEQ